MNEASEKEDHSIRNMKTKYSQNGAIASDSKANKLQREAAPRLETINDTSMNVAEDPHLHVSRSRVAIL